MSRGPGLMQREILRRASRPLSVRAAAQFLFVDFDRSQLGAVRRAMQSLVRMGYLRRSPAGYVRTNKRQQQRGEWRVIGPTPQPTNGLLQIAPREANVILRDRHYLGAAHYRPRFCLTTPTRDALALYAPPIAVHFKTMLDSPLELTRLWRADDADVILSQFLAATLRWLRREAPDADCVFSYADSAAWNPITGRRHNGGIYTASNFTCLGEARATDHWIDDAGDRVTAAKCYRMMRTKSRERIAELRPTWRLVPGERKLLYLYPLRMSVAQVLERIGERGRYGATHDSALNLS